MKRLLVVLMTMGLLCCSVGAAEKSTTRQVLSKLNDDMQKVWRDYGGDKQKDTRERALQDLQSQFQKDLPLADVPTGMTMHSIIKKLVDNMEDARTTFRVEKMVQTRNQYQTACAAAFKREFPKASDYTEARTTQKVFDLMMDWLEEARDGLRQVNTEGQTGAYQAINEGCTGMLNGATIPENEDSIAQLDKNLKEARRRFSIATDTLKKANAPILTLAENRAKEIQQKNLKGNKK
jgi:hypothetical protein